MWDVPINVIREQWTTVTDHLTLSAALIVFGFFLGWSFCWLYFRQQLNVSKDRIEHYKERLGEITPAERLKRQKIREALGELMVEGQGILRLYRNLSSVQPE